MNSFLLTISFLILLGLPASSVVGQDINIKKIELENDKVYLVYDLIDSTQDRVYTIRLYSSHDNFISPLQKATGDLGLEVRPGINRQIEINLMEEYSSDFEGKVAFELRANAYMPFIRLDHFNEYKKFKRGKPYEIHWYGGRPQNVLNFDLYKGDTKIQTFANIANRGSYVIIFPPDTKPGKNYWFKISDPHNRDEIVNTKVFAITSKIPLMYKIVPLVIVGTLAYFLLKPKEETTGYLPEFPNNLN